MSSVLIELFGQYMLKSIKEIQEEGSVFKKKSQENQLPKQLSLI